MADQSRPAAAGAPRPAAVTSTTVTIQPVTVRTLFLAGAAILGLALGVWLVWHLFNQFLLVLTSIILAEGLRPGASLIHRLGLPFSVGIAAMYGGLILAIVVLVAVLSGPVLHDLALLPAYSAQIINTINSSVSAFNLTGDRLSQLAGTVLGAVGGFAGGILRLGGGLAGLLGDLASIFLLSVTWMAASGDLRTFVLSLFSPGRRELVGALTTETSRAFAGYVRGVAINMIAIGALATLACWALRLPGPLVLGVFAGFCELIPLLGPFLGAVPAVLLGFTISPAYPLIVAAVYLALQQLESNVLTPVVMRRQTGLRPFLILLSLIVGAALAGIWGALVAVPVGSALQIVVVRVVAPALKRRHEGDAPSAAEERVEVAAPP
ncbi:MAG TPA: AI-2E family transporter [Candidatus Dormibacteraeota bacterium]